MSQEFDVIVIGSGPAGYVSAIRAAQLGFKTACVESWKDDKGGPVVGGACLNVGCIPSKVLLEASHHYMDIQSRRFESFGLTIDNAALDVKKLIAYKEKIVGQLSGGVKNLLKSNGVTLIQGRGKVTGVREVSVDGTPYAAAHILLATGSRPIEIPAARFDAQSVVDSTGALSFTQAPKRLGIVGAGVIGLELGSVWRRLGSEVVLFEAMSQFLPMADEEIANEAYKIFSGEEKLNILLGAKVLKTQVLEDKSVQVSYEKDGKEQVQLFDKLVVCVGRRPNSQDLFDPKVGLKTNERGFIEVNQYCHTGIGSIHAIGDLVRGPMLAHKGSEEGLMVIERLKGEKTQVNYDAIPSVVYTSPEIAWVGKTEQELRESLTPYKKGSFPFQASGRAVANGDTRGMVKLLIHEKTDRLLGGHILGAHAGELLGQLVTTIEFQGSAEDLILTVFAHPTLSEAVHEAALATHRRSIHTINRKF